jgi:hypothetical protein
MSDALWFRKRLSDMEALRIEVEVDSSIRRYEKFYVRVLDEPGAGVGDHT